MPETFLTDSLHFIEHERNTFSSSSPWNPFFENRKCGVDGKSRLIAIVTLSSSEYRVGFWGLTRGGEIGIPISPRSSPVEGTISLLEQGRETIELIRSLRLKFLGNKT